MRKMLDMSVLLLRVANDDTQRIGKIVGTRCGRNRCRRSAGALLAGFAIAALGGCDQLKGGSSEVAECEAYIQRHLKAPATYERTGLMVSDSPLLTALEFQKRMRDPKPPPEPQLRLRRVSITFEAKNVFGVPLSDLEICHFKVTEAQRDAELISPSEVPRELYDKEEREWAEEEAAHPFESEFSSKPPSRRFGCCLPPAGS